MSSLFRVLPGGKRELGDEGRQVELTDAVFLSVNAGSIDQDLKSEKNAS